MIEIKHELIGNLKLEFYRPIKVEWILDLWTDRIIKTTWIINIMKKKFR